MVLGTVSSGHKYLTENTNGIRIARKIFEHSNWYPRKRVMANIYLYGISKCLAKRHLLQLH